MQYATTTSLLANYVFSVNETINIILNEVFNGSLIKLEVEKLKNAS